MTVDEMIDDILRKEGGYVNHPADRGGPTNFGVTQRVYSRWLGRRASINDVKNMTKHTARAIYFRNYYERPKINMLPKEIQPQVFDMSINHGAGRAVKILQKAIRNAGFRIKVDGGIGPKTAGLAGDALKKLGSVKFNNKIAKVRIDFYHAIVRNRPSQKVFLRGWLNRANTFVS